MRSWIAPKVSHKKFVTRLLQLHTHLILCFRAEAKIEMERDEKTKKTKIVAKKGLTGLDGWFPICDKNLPYEMTISVLLLADEPGVPHPIKLMAKHRPFFPDGKPITRETGRLLAEWAKGGSPSPLPGALPAGTVVHHALSGEESAKHTKSYLLPADWSTLTAICKAQNVTKEALTDFIKSIGYAKSSELESKDFGRVLKWAEAGGQEPL